MPGDSNSLLRRPRLPTIRPAPPSSPPPLSYTSELEYANPIYDSNSPYNHPVYQSRTGSHSKSVETRIMKSNSSYHNFLTRHNLNADNRYVLDPYFRDKTSLGTYVEGQPLLKAYKPRGPDALPMRTIKSKNNAIVKDIFEENMERYEKRNEFILNDFLIDFSKNENIPYHRVKSAMLSRHNYKQIQQLLSDLCLEPQDKINTIQMSSDEINKVSPRIPQTQLLIQMAALVKRQMSEQMNIPMKTKIRSLPKYIVGENFSHPPAHSEIVVIPASNNSRMNTVESTLKSITNSSIKDSSEGLIHDTDVNIISHSELAILDSLMNGGKALSLKAHFICTLPNIEALVKTLIYLNLSFNDFKHIPFDTFDLSNLMVLKLRNNPIHEITSDIAMLRCLKVIVVSFCMISTLPLGLFTLKDLEILDLAYNRLTFIPDEIRKLQALKTLNLEGNQLGAMPYGSLTLKNLTQLNVKGNYMHPYFWKENSKNNPQSLCDLAALSYCRSEQDNSYLDDCAVQLLNCRVTCNCCLGAMYGSGLRVIRPVEFMFGIRHVPFMFHSCSPQCLKRFKSGLCDNQIYAQK